MLVVVVAAVGGTSISDNKEINSRCLTPSRDVVGLVTLENRSKEESQSNRHELNTGRWRVDKSWLRAMDLTPELAFAGLRSDIRQPTVLYNFVDLLDESGVD